MHAVSAAVVLFAIHLASSSITAAINEELAEVCALWYKGGRKTMISSEDELLVPASMKSIKEIILLNSMK